MKLSAIIPTKRRGAQCAKMIERLFETTQGQDVEAIVVAYPTPDLDAVFNVMTRYPLRIYLDLGNAIAAWNLGASMANGDTFLIVDDDSYFYPDWLTCALESYTTGFVGLNDLYTNGADWSTRYLMRRECVVNVLGGVVQVPHYRSWCADLETCRRAQAAGRYVYEPRAIVEHRHWQLGKAPQDETYRDGDKEHAADQQIYELRAAMGFPSDYNAVVRLKP